MKRIIIIFLALSFSGCVKSQTDFHYDKDGLKDGFWETTDIQKTKIQPDKKIISKGSYSHGKKIGVWKYSIIDVLPLPPGETQTCRGSAVFEEKEEEFFDNGDIKVTRYDNNGSETYKTYTLKINRDSSLITGQIYSLKNKSVKCEKSRSIINCKIINSKNKTIDTCSFKFIDLISDKLDIGLYDKKL